MPAVITGSQTGTVGLINTLAAQNSTSGTAIDFTGIPSGVRRVTVMFSGVSTNGTSNYQVQIGSGSVSTTGYVGTASGTSNSGNVVNIVSFTAGFGLTSIISATSTTISGTMIITCLSTSTNTWTASGAVGAPPATYTGGFYFGGVKALGGALDRVRITTVNGTDAFNAGTINVLYE